MERMDHSVDRNDRSEEEDNKLKAKVARPYFSFLFFSLTKRVKLVSKVQFVMNKDRITVFLTCTLH